MNEKKTAPATIYVIGASARMDEARDVIKHLQGEGFDVFDWTKHFTRDDHTPNELAEIGARECNEIISAEIVCALHPLGEGGRFELGFAQALRREIIHAGTTNPGDVFTAGVVPIPVSALTNSDIVERVIAKRRARGIRSAVDDIVALGSDLLLSTTQADRIDLMHNPARKEAVAIARGERQARILKEAVTIAQEEFSAARTREVLRKQR